MQVNQFPFLLLLTLLAVSCAKERDSKPSDLYFLNAKNLEDAQDKARNALVTCESNCHPAVGLLSMAGHFEEGWAAAQCTASLVGPDIAVTNGHCIPDDLPAAAGADCRERIWLSFPESREHPEYDGRLGCAKVLYRHRDPGANGADYAYLRLDRASNRPPLRFSRAGIGAGEVFEVQKVNPVVLGGRLGGMLIRTRCRAHLDSVVFPGGRDSLSPAQLLSDCLVIKGNSGSPLIAGDLTIRGVMHAFLKKDVLADDLKKSGMPAPAPADINELNLATNFACLLNPAALNGSDIPASCQDLPRREAQRKAEWKSRVQETLEQSAQALVEKSAPGRPELQAFRWGLGSPALNGAAETLTGQPGCVWSSPSHPLAPLPPTIQRPVFLVHAVLNTYLTPEFTVAWGGLGAEKESLELSGTTEGSLFSLRISGSQGASELTLRPCP